MKIKIPHPFHNHDKYFHVKLNKFYLKPWRSQIVDETFNEITVYDNYAGWLWFAVNWYSSDF